MVAGDPQSALSYMIGLKSDFSLDCLIYYAAIQGMFIDSSYRNKNEDRAPLFAIGTADLQARPRFLPGS